MKASAHTYRRMRVVAHGRQVFRSRAGQALTELSLVIPVLVLLLLGVLDLGRAFHTQVALANAARVGLVYGQQVVSPRGCVDVSCPFLTVQQIISQTVAEAQGGVNLTPSDVTVCVDTTCVAPTDTAAQASTLVLPDKPLTITISAPFQAITPFVHLPAVHGSASGRTFAYDPTQPTPIGGLPNPVTPSPTATLMPTSVPWNGPSGGTGTTNTLNGITCPPTTTTCVGVGNGGTLVTYDAYANTWSSRSSGTTQDLNGVACLSATTCFAVGDIGTIVATTDGGATWNAPASGSSTTSPLNQTLTSVACATAPSPACYAVGSNGTILRYDPGTQTWASQTSPITQGLKSLTCADATTCYAVGYNGTILKGSNLGGSGAGWSPEYSSAGVAGSLNGVSCPSTTTCVAVGIGGTIIATTDGGATWNAPSSGSPTTSSLNAVACFSGGACYAVGATGAILSATTPTGPWSVTGSGSYTTWNALACPTPSASPPTPFGSCSIVGASGSNLTAGLPLPTPTPTVTQTPTPAPTNTPGPTSTPTRTPTSTPVPTATNTPLPTATSTPQPAPIVTNLTCTNDPGVNKTPCATNTNATYVTISWTTNENNATNTVYYRLMGTSNSWTAVPANFGTAPTVSFHVSPYNGGGYTVLDPAPYEYYITSASSAPLTTTVPSGCPASCSPQYFKLH